MHPAHIAVCEQSFQSRNVLFDLGLDPRVYRASNFPACRTEGLPTFAVERFSGKSLRASRLWSRAASIYALVSVLWQHSGIRGIFCAFGSANCAASSRSVVNSRAASVTLVRVSVCLSRLYRNLSITSCWLNRRGLVGLTVRLWASLPQRSTVAITMLWSESGLTGGAGCGWTTTFYTLLRCACLVRM